MATLTAALGEDDTMLFIRPGRLKNAPARMRAQTSRARFLHIPDKRADISALVSHISPQSVQATAVQDAKACGEAAIRSCRERSLP